MNETHFRIELEILIKYQEIRLAIRETKSEAAKIPIAIQKIEDQFLSRYSEFESRRKELEDCHKARRDMELNLKDFEAHISKYQEQRWAVKTNAECAAIIRQIESAKKEALDMEEQILLNMERCDEIEKTTKSKKVELDREKAEFEKEKQKHLDRLATLNKKVKGMEQEKADIEKMLSKETKALFEKTAKVRGGVVITKIKDGRCGGCNMVVRPQLIHDVKKGEGILQCENCERILYYHEAEEKTNEVSGEESAGPTQIE